MEIKEYVFETNGDERGQLVALEANINIPFDIKRVYYMYETSPGAVRGKHAHRNLEQILICVHGSCMLKLDDGHEKIEIYLHNPNKGIYISNSLWREMYDFSADAVLMVLASEAYDEADYIRDYDEFLRYIGCGE